MNRKTLTTAAYWVATIFGPTSFVIGGVLGLMQTPDVVANTTHLGYPAYFAALLGGWKLLGAIALTVPGIPRVKEWAYAGFFFDLTSAALAHAAVGDSTLDIVTPLVFLALVATSWALRPASRTLPSRGATAKPVALGNVPATPVFATE